MEWVDKNVRPVFMPYIIDGIYECVQHMPRGSELISYRNNLNRVIIWLVKIAFLQKSNLSYFFRSSLTRAFQSQIKECLDKVVSTQMKTDKK